MKKRDSSMKILVAVDNDALGQALVEFVSAHYWSGTAEFKIVYVADLIGPTAETPKSLCLELLDDLKQAGELVVSDIAEQLQKTFLSAKISKVILEGRAQEQIIKYAKRWKADVIVMGAHGRTGIIKAILGSVSSAVLSEAPCTVIVVRPQRASKPFASANASVSRSI
jgi:nucleotide-binding universal stress UspA family protein